MPKAECFEDTEDTALSSCLNILNLKFISSRTFQVGQVSIFKFLIAVFPQVVLLCQKQSFLKKPPAPELKEQPYVNILIFDEYFKSIIR